MLLLWLICEKLVFLKKFYPRELFGILPERKRAQEYRSHINDAFGAPSMIGALIDAEVEIGGGLDLSSRMVFLRIDRLAVEHGPERASRC